MIKLKPEKHKHIWKYWAQGTIRTCEAPIPTIPSCGKTEKVSK